MVVPDEELMAGNCKFEVFSPSVGPSCSRGKKDSLPRFVFVLCADANEESAALSSLALDAIDRQSAAAVAADCSEEGGVGLKRYITSIYR